MLFHHNRLYVREPLFSPVDPFAFLFGFLFQRERGREFTAFPSFHYPNPSAALIYSFVLLFK